MRTEKTKFKIQDSRVRNLDKKTGFTLVEMMVSVAIFSIIMTIASGAILTIISANRTSQSFKSVLDNLNTSLDTMSRTIRYGSTYDCVVDPAATQIIPSATPTVNDCPSGGKGITFFDKDNIIEAYQFVVDNADGSGHVERSVGGGAFLTLTSPEVHIRGLWFYVTGTDTTDDLQPKVRMTVNGYAGDPKNKADFDIETVVSQRNPDFPTIFTLNVVNPPGITSKVAVARMYTGVSRSQSPQYPQCGPYTDVYYDTNGPITQSQPLVMSNGVSCPNQSVEMLQPAYTLTEVGDNNPADGPFSDQITTIHNLASAQNVNVVSVEPGSIPPPGSFNITASSGGNGTVSPAGVSVVSSRGSQGYSITPDSGYQIDDVIVDGGSVGAQSSYSFSNVTANHSISASFSSVGTPPGPPVKVGWMYSTDSVCQGDSGASEPGQTDFYFDPAGSASQSTDYGVTPSSNSPSSGTYNYSDICPVNYVHIDQSGYTVYINNDGLNGPFSGVGDYPLSGSGDHSNPGPATGVSVTSP